MNVFSAIPLTTVRPALHGELAAEFRALSARLGRYLAGRARPETVPLEVLAELVRELRELDRQRRGRC